MDLTLPTSVKMKVGDTFVNYPTKEYVKMMLRAVRGNGFPNATEGDVKRQLCFIMNGKPTDAMGSLLVGRVKFD